MASAPSDPRPVLGRVDRAGRLVAADPELATLQMEAGSTVGAALALPQVAAVARLARKLGIPVSRPALAASAKHDIDMWVRAVPEGEEVALALEGWTVRPPRQARLAALLGGDNSTQPVAEAGEWAADSDLKLTSLSGSLAERLGAEPADLIGQPLTRVFRLDENEAGEMPLIAALAARHGFSGQPAIARSGDPGATLMLSADVIFGPDGSFAGFSGRAVPSGDSATQPPQPSLAAIDQVLNEALRSPLDRIIDCAERIADRADGPLRSDYAVYATDISAAARHLLSVIHSMSEDTGQGHRTIDLAALAAEAVVLVEPSAEPRGIRFAIEGDESLPASGEERAVIQILVNLIGNAVRHSPAGGTVTLRFDRTSDLASVTVSDEGPGIAPADQQRIFERFERAGPDEGGTGLGLAISRRLARSMGGDIHLESAPELGARFMLILPSA
ncbi:HAMP domain-containing sensor histidine kinase [Sphingomonas sp.]|uniref:sensor histidine kinase n=1 Tax=Sphingomonas sp. TaxID=28214 RepID=UPI0017A64E46|nr:HAMP domain-containing sensor histidine kinase [Sphingomonas sp.]MBA3512104.1 HAMP domain-containing histidine kinase [Sphingomonas sp.]